MKASYKIWFFAGLCLHGRTVASNGVGRPAWGRSRGSSEDGRRLSYENFPHWDSGLFETPSNPGSVEKRTTALSMGKSGKSSNPHSSAPQMSTSGSIKSGKGKGASKEKGKKSSSKSKSQIYQMNERPHDKSKKDKKVHDHKKDKGSGKKSTSDGKKGKKHSYEDGDDSENEGLYSQPTTQDDPYHGSNSNPPAMAPTYHMPVAPTNPSNPKNDLPTPNTPPARPSSSSTTAPTPSGEAVELTPFGLEYSFSLDRRPLDSEISAAVSVTNTYLNGFTRQRVDPLNELDTKLVSSTYVRSTPFQVTFQSIAFIRPGAFPQPTVAELDQLLTLAFSGQNLKTYVGLLEQLPGTNIFSTTVDVFDLKSRGGNSPPVGTKTASTQGSQGPSKFAIGASVGAGAFIALLLGIGMCRRKDRYESVEMAKAIADGHATVAGETYVGNVTMYSSSEVSGRMPGGRLPDDNRSEWATSTRAITEDGSASVSEEMDTGYHTGGPLEEQLDRYVTYSNPDPLQPLQNYDGYQDPTNPTDNDESSHFTKNTIGSQSEESNVPMRVVDLIKKFSPI